MVRTVADGPLVRRGNRALRAVLLGVTDNLLMCNRYFRTLAAGWKTAQHAPRLIQSAWPYGSSELPTTLLPDGKYVNIQRRASEGTSWQN
jgi:hypothetical protein